MAIDASALARPVGPLPLWGWGVLAAGGAVLLLARRGHPAAAAIADPNTPVPAAPVDPGALAPAAPSYPPMTVGPGQGVYDPQTGGTSQPITVSDVLGGDTLSGFIGKLGPDYQNFQFSSGNTGLSVQHSAQNLLDAANYQTGLEQQTIQQKNAADAQYQTMMGTAAIVRAYGENSVDAIKAYGDNYWHALQAGGVVGAPPTLFG